MAGHADPAAEKTIARLEWRVANPKHPIMVSARRFDWPARFQAFSDRTVKAPHPAEPIRRRTQRAFPKPRSLRAPIYPCGLSLEIKWRAAGTPVNTQQHRCDKERKHVSEAVVADAKGIGEPNHKGT